MSPNPSVALILGSGPNIGASVAKQLASDGWKVVIANRSASKSSDQAFPSLPLDLSKPESVEDAFTQLRNEHGEPSLVVYNAGAVAFSKDPFEIDLATFQDHLTINTTSAFVAIKQALKSFASPNLPKDAAKTFIYTGNAMNFGPFAGLLTLGVGKSASANMLAAAAAAYKDKGYKFYYADERRADGSLAGKGISGEAHALLYKQLSESKTQGPWLQTFVKGQGYVSFPPDTDIAPKAP